MVRSTIYSYILSTEHQTEDEGPDPHEPGELGQAGAGLAALNPGGSPPQGRGGRGAEESTGCDCLHW